MLPTDLERAVANFQIPRDDSLQAPEFPVQLERRLLAIERRHGWRRFLQIVKACASQLVLDGDEPSDESN